MPRRVSRAEVLAHIGFCATGVLSAVTIDYTQLRGMKDDFVEIFPSFVGPSFCCVFLFFQHGNRRYDWKFWIVVGCDFLGMILLVTSISLAGSALFFITFSWITVFAAALKRVFLGKDQTPYQWFAIIFMTLGLCSSAAGADLDYGIEVFYGILAGFGSAIVYSVYYITCDVIGHQKDAPSPEALAAFDGLVGTWILGAIILTFKGPNWEKDVIEPVQKAHGNYRQITGGYVILALSYLVHQLGFFYIAKHSGCVLAGINKAIQTVTVFVVSTIFCQVQPSQCFSWPKAVSLCLVVAGVLMYSHASSFVEHPHEHSEEEVDKAAVEAYSKSSMGMGMGMGSSSKGGGGEGKGIGPGGGASARKHKNSDAHMSINMVALQEVHADSSQETDSMLPTSPSTPQRRTKSRFNTPVQNIEMIALPNMSAQDSPIGKGKVLARRKSEKVLVSPGAQRRGLHSVSGAEDNTAHSVDANGANGANSANGTAAAIISTLTMSPTRGRNPPKRKASDSGDSWPSSRSSPTDGPVSARLHVPL